MEADANYWNNIKPTNLDRELRRYEKDMYFQKQPELLKTRETKDLEKFINKAEKKNQNAKMRKQKIQNDRNPIFQNPVTPN